MKRIVTGLAITGVLLAVWGAAGLAQDKPLKKVVFAVTTKDISVGHSAHSSMPQALGYWKEEGLDVTVTSVEGSAAGMQQLAAGNLQIVSLGPEEIVIGREKGVKIKGFYVQARETIYRIVVAADSPLQKLADLKGKTIGVPALASGSVPFAKALVASVGLDPEKDVKILAVGVGAPGRLALQQKTVDCLALWDTLQASIENSGMQLRRLDSPLIQEMLGQTLATRDDQVTENAAILVGFARGVAKATVFGLANPEAAIRIHWKMYPQTKPQTGDEAKALKDALNVFNARFSLQRVDNRPDPRFGIGTLPQWEKLENIFKQYKFVEGTVPAAELYTAALIDQINKFDRAAIVEQAKAYKP
ncbi:MAG TPA: ABC transporter substrate-binding protein [Methylomirabilota bacterium]